MYEYVKKSLTQKAKRDHDIQGMAGTTTTVSKL